MKKIMTAGTALLLTTTLAHAGGIDRSLNNYGVLFEDGDYMELGFSVAKPDVSGDYIPALGGISTGDMAEDYASLSFSYKNQLTDNFALGVFLNSPYGADANYPAGIYTGLQAEWESKQIGVVGKYNVNDNFSVYGGLRVAQSSATVALPDTLIRGGLAASGDPQGAAIAANAPAGTLAYSASTDKNTDTGYILGAAYERPEIALRVALTYESGLTHEFESAESIPAIAPAFPGQTTIEMPQSVTLDFQSGVAKDTLVFGSIRWSEWSVWEVRPPLYESLTGANVTGIDNDVMTYRIGVGRRINDELSVFGRITYEDSDGGVASRLAPTDGSTAIGFGGSYTKDNVKITGGIEYVMLGDATDGSGTAFTDNSAIGFGLSIGYSF